MGSPFFSFHAAQRRAPAVEISFDLYARTRQTRHDGTDRNALHLGNFALPPERGDYGGNVVGAMRTGGVFVSVLEHAPADLDTRPVTLRTPRPWWKFWAD